MENSPKLKIHVDNRAKSQLANKLPEPAMSMLKEEPEEMDLDTFIDHMGFIEKLVRKLEDKAKMGGDEDGVSPVSSVSILLVFSFALAVLSLIEFKVGSGKWVTTALGLVLLILGYHFYSESDLHEFLFHQGDEHRSFE
jgi:hypothetical protein